MFDLEQCVNTPLQCIRLICQVQEHLPSSSPAVKSELCRESHLVTGNVDCYFHNPEQLEDSSGQRCPSFPQLWTGGDGEAAHLVGGVYHHMTLIIRKLELCAGLFESSLVSLCPVSPELTPDRSGLRL